MNLLDQLDNLNQVVANQEYLEAEQARVKANYMQGLSRDLRVQNSQELMSQFRTKLRGMKKMGMIGGGQAKGQKTNGSYGKDPVYNKDGDLEEFF